MEDNLHETEDTHCKNLLNFYAACNSFENISNLDSNCSSFNINHDYEMNERSSLRVNAESEALPTRKKEQKCISNRYNKYVSDRTTLIEPKQFLFLSSNNSHGNNGMEQYKKRKSLLYSNLKSLLQHLSSDSENTKFYVCDACKEKFLLKSRLKRHIRQCDHGLLGLSKRKTCKVRNIFRDTTSSLLYTCDSCHKNFSLKSHLKRHIAKCQIYSLSNINKRTKWKICCPKCDRTFPLKATLQKHINSNSCSISCKICGYVPRKPCELKRHTVKHTRERIFCPHCNKKFCRAYLLRNHLTNHKTQFYRCTECTKKFIYLEELKYHRAMAHFAGRGNNLEEGRLRSRENSAVKKFFCDYCEVNFEIEDSYKDHMTKHLPPKSRPKKKVHKCKFCDKEFTIKLWLQYHVTDCKNSITSSNFMCVACNLNFKEADEFEYHKSIHPIEKLKPFGCASCEKRFVRRKLLIRHLNGCPF